MTKDNG